MIDPHDKLLGSWGNTLFCTEDNLGSLHQSLLLQIWMHTCNLEWDTKKCRFGRNCLCRDQGYSNVLNSHQLWGFWCLHLRFVVSIVCLDRQKRVFLLSSELRCTSSSSGDGRYACTFEGWKDHLSYLNSDQKVTYISSISTHGLDPFFLKAELHVHLPFIAALSVQDSFSQDFLLPGPSVIPL